MANLSKAIDPRRVLIWNGKSLANCSRNELIDCIVYITRRLAAYEAKHNSQVIQQAAEIQDEPIPSEAVQSYNSNENP